jgi:uncharacterized Zn finger protein (UPF0148 family)
MSRKVTDKECTDCGGPVEVNTALRTTWCQTCHVTRMWVTQEMRESHAEAIMRILERMKDG